MRIGITLVAGLALVGAASSGMASTEKPGSKQLARGVERFLERQGDLCVGKFTWPRDVTEQDRQAGSNDAIQLPVLERLGLVSSEEIPAGPQAETVVHRYTLTVQGQQYYLRKKRIALEAHEQPVEHDGDFCVARLSLDKVVKWSSPEPVQGQPQTDVSYTYRIKAASWMSDPEARRVFPMVDRIIRGEGSIQMNATVRLQAGEWVPVLP